MSNLRGVHSVRSFEVFDNRNSKNFLSIDTPVARKAILLGVALLALKQFTGSTAMVNYAGEIFKVSGSNVDPNLSAIIIGVIQVIATFTPTLLVDRAGRKVVSYSWISWMNLSTYPNQ